MKITWNKISTKLSVWAFLITAITLIACNPQSRGFALPEGDVNLGKITFTELHCNQCHSVGDIPWAGLPGDVQLELGGTVTSIKSYGELLTSVINPSHQIAQKYLGDQVAKEGKSNMRNYNDIMTVQQLVDIVTFLQSEYEIESPSNYYPYH